MDEKMLHIEGAVENVLFKNEENGYAVVDLDAGGELITAVGDLGDVEEGEILILEGQYSSHKKFGVQFKAVYCERKLPSTAVNIEKYLASGAIKGVGPGLAKKIVAVFGEDSLDIIENDPHRLSEIKGISAAKCEEIAGEARKIFSLRKVMTFLSQYGIKSQYAMHTYKKYGGDAMELVQTNPYILCGDDIDLEFEKADSIAADLRFERNSDKRIIAGTQYILKANAAVGHSCLPLSILCDKAQAFLGVSESDFYSAYNAALDDNELFEYWKSEREYAYLPDYFYAEQFIADRVNILRDFSSPEDFDYDALINIEEEEHGVQYEELQRRAITTAVSRGLMILTGGPGTGKTTTLNAIISIFEKKGFKVLLAAPTGRAAKRMTDLTDRDAKTIHRLLEVVYDAGGRPAFAHNENNPLDCDVLVVDEMSMVDVVLFEKLLRAVRLGCKLIMVGDSNQLPSVGAGNLLGDLIDSGRVPVVFLKEIFRQARKSCIVTNAHMIVSGEYPDLTRKDNDFFFFKRSEPETAAQLVCDLAEKRLPAAYKVDRVNDIQILCPSRKGTVGAIELNKLLQEKLNPPAEGKGEIKDRLYVFRDGDKVMQTRNNYDIVWRKGDERGAGIYNGDIGRILSVNATDRIATVDFDGKVAIYTFDLLSQLELAYAATVHKSQGCEFEIVIIPLLGGFNKLAYRSLLYTAVTRAKKLLIIVGKEEEIQKMVDNNRGARRYSCLRAMLCEGRSSGYDDGVTPESFAVAADEGKDEDNG